MKSKGMISNETQAWAYLADLWANASDWELASGRRLPSIEPVKTNPAQPCFGLCQSVARLSLIADHGMVDCMKARLEEWLLARGWDRTYMWSSNYAGAGERVRACHELGKLSLGKAASK